MAMHDEMSWEVQMAQHCKYHVKLIEGLIMKV